MARGHDRHQAHQAALAALGRGISRRAKSACELCQGRDDLAVTEIEGGPSEPDPDWAILACGRCRGAMAPRARLEPDTMRFLEEAIWAELRPAQIAAVRLVNRLAEGGADWARDAADGLYLDPEVEALI